MSVLSRISLANWLALFRDLLMSSIVFLDSVNWANAWGDQTILFPISQYLDEIGRFKSLNLQHPHVKLFFNRRMIRCLDTY